MIVPALGRWSHRAGARFVLDRIYFRSRWTPFARIRRRYAHRYRPTSCRACDLERDRMEVP